MMMPDGFTGYPDFLALTEADGAYLSFTGLSIDQFPKGGVAAAAPYTENELVGASP